MMMNKFLKRGLFSLLLVPAFLCTTIKEPRHSPISTEEEQSPMHACEMMTREKLNSKELAIYDQLGPIYQKTFLYALNAEERYRVVTYTKRGLNPFQAMDVLLRSERRRCEKSSEERCDSPASRSQKSTKPLHVF